MAERDFKRWFPGEFVMVPWAVQEAAIRAKLSRAEWLTVLGLLKHADRSSGRTWPGADLLASETRLQRRTIERSLARLEGLGLMVCIQRGGGGTGGRKQATVYQMINPDGPVGVCGAETPTADATETPTAQAGNPDGAGRKPRRPGRANRVEQMHEQSSRNRQAACPAAAEVLEELKIQRIGAAARERLARHPGVTVQVIRAAVQQHEQLGGRTGLLIRRIEDEADRANALANRHRRQAQAMARDLAQREQIERASPGNGQGKTPRLPEPERLPPVPPSEVERLAREVLADESIAMSRRTAWRSLGLDKAPAFDEAMRRRWKLQQGG